MSLQNRQKVSCNTFLCRTWPALPWTDAKVTSHSFTDELVNSPLYKLTSDSPSLKFSQDLIRVTNKIINKIAIDNHLFGRMVSLLGNHQRLKIHKGPGSPNQYFMSFIKTMTSLLVQRARDLHGESLWLQHRSHHEGTAGWSLKSLLTTQVTDSDYWVLNHYLKQTASSHWDIAYFYFIWQRPNSRKELIMFKRNFLFW